MSAPNEDSAARGVNGNQADNSATNAGAVYVFQNSAANGWTFDSYLKPSLTAPYALFGAQVGFSGNVVAIGSPGDSSSKSGDTTNDNRYDGKHDQSGATFLFARRLAPLVDVPLISGDSGVGSQTTVRGQVRTELLAVVCVRVRTYVCVCVCMIPPPHMIDVDDRSPLAATCLLRRRARFC